MKDPIYTKAGLPPTLIFQYSPTQMTDPAYINIPVYGWCNYTVGNVPGPDMFAIIKYAEVYDRFQVDEVDVDIMTTLCDMVKAELHELWMYSKGFL